MINAYRPAEAFPPGDFIREELEDRGWTQSDLAEITGRPLAAINEMINGKRKITDKSAAELGSAFGIDPRYWMNLERDYRLWLRGSSEKSNELAQLMAYAPVREMQRRGWIPRQPDDLRTAVLGFFGVDSLEERPRLAAAFRQSADQIANAHMAWCVFAMRKAKAQTVGQHQQSDSDRLRLRLRSLAAHSEEIRKVPGVLAEFGIRFVIVKQLSSTKIDGATLWLDEAKKSDPVIAMSLRHGRIDNFWHTLCHELSHVYHRDSFRLDLDLAESVESDAKDDVERRSDEEATTMLIPRHQLESFILRKRPYFSAKSIIQFAHTVGIHPGIVVGQLRFREAIKYSHSSAMLVQIREMITETAVSDGWIETA